MDVDLGSGLEYRRLPLSVLFQEASALLQKLKVVDALFSLESVLELAK